MIPQQQTMSGSFLVRQRDYWKKDYSLKPEPQAEGTRIFEPRNTVRRLAPFDVALSETELQGARGASRGNGVLVATDAGSLSLRFGLQSMYFLTDFFADRRERATSKLAPRASRSSATLNAPSNSGSDRTGSTAEHCSLAPRSPLRASVSLCEQKIHRRVAHSGTKSPQPA